MSYENVTGVTFAACNTDSQSLMGSPVPVKVLMGEGPRPRTPSHIPLRLFSHLSPLILHLSPLKINVKHVLTHRILLADFYLCEVGEKPSLPPDYIWIPETELDHYAVPRLIEKFLQDFK